MVGPKILAYDMTYEQSKVINFSLRWRYQTKNWHVVTPLDTLVTKFDRFKFVRD